MLFYIFVIYVKNITQIIAFIGIKRSVTERTYYEIDFVANKGSQRYYIQSAFEMSDAEKREQETKSLESVSDGFKKIIVVKDVVKPYYDEKGILTIGLFDFLMDSSWM
jgi:predicted AAA+ superfamily ATPase